MSLHPSTSALSTAVLQAPVQPGSLALDSWASYYRLRGLPLESPAALLLDAVLTLHAAVARLQQQLGALADDAHRQQTQTQAQGHPIVAAVQQQQQQQGHAWDQQGGGAGVGHARSQPGAEQRRAPPPPLQPPPALPQPLVLHLVGPQRELDAWPLLLELGCLLPPSQQLEVHLVGPEVPPWAHGRALRVPPPADGPCGRPGCSCARAEGLHGAGAAHPACMAGAEAAAGATGALNEQQRQPRQPLEAGSRECSQQRSEAGSQAGSQALFFWRGEWHELAAELARQHGAPHAVVGPNAGKRHALLSSCIQQAGRLWCHVMMALCQHPCASGFA